MEKSTRKSVRRLGIRVHRVRAVEVLVNSLHVLAVELARVVLALAAAAVVEPRDVVLSNTRLPVDSDGNPLITGETSVLEHDGSYYV